MNDVVISKDIIRKYYEAIDKSIEGDYYCIKEFGNIYPRELKRLSAIHRKRSKINKAIKSIRSLNKIVYWGTLTFNKVKDKNSEKTKRRESFMFLNTLFDYFLIVEEYGEENKRYHIHFVGSMKYGLSIKDFIKKWKSRTDIQEVNSKSNISSYLCKYMSKDLPRIRCNKMLVKLIKGYSSGVNMDNLGFNTLGVDYQVQKVNCLNVFDLD